MNKEIDVEATIDAFEASGYPASMSKMDASLLQRINRSRKEYGGLIYTNDRIAAQMVLKKYPELALSKKKKVQFRKDDRYAQIINGSILLDGNLDDGDIKKSDLPYWVERMEGSWRIKSHRGTPFHAPMGVIIDELEDLGFRLSDPLQRMHDKRKPNRKASLDLDFTGQTGTLYGFQQWAVEEIERWNGRVILADDMGLGKTPTVLSWLYGTNKPVFPALIICPSSLKINWSREITKWTPGLKFEVLSGRTPDREELHEETDIFIINYDVLADWLDILLDYQFQFLAADEIHLCKNMKAQRTQAFLELAAEIPYFIPITGTPVLKNPKDLWPILNALDPYNWGNMRWFEQTYCKPKFTHGRMIYGTSRSLLELHKRLKKTGMIRRTKDMPEIAAQLPKKEKHVIALEIDNMREYMAAEAKYANWANGEGKNSNQIAAFAKIQELRTLAYLGKERQVIRWIKDVIDGQGKKLIVMAYHRKVIADLNAAFKGRVVRVQGGMSDIQKQKAVDAFQHDSKIDLFTGNIKAAGVGLDLTAAHITCNIELDWNPMNQDQADDRAHRLTQQADTVFSYYLIAANTIEEDIMEIHDKKRQIANAVTDGRETADEEMLMVLMDRISQRQLNYKS